MTLIRINVNVIRSTLTMSTTATLHQSNIASITANFTTVLDTNRCQTVLSFFLSELSQLYLNL